MKKRDPQRSENELVSEAGELPTPGQGSRSGGNLAREVGTRTELRAAFGGARSVERVTGNDDPRADAEKGPKTQTALSESK